MRCKCFARETPLKLLRMLAVLRIGNVFDADPYSTFSFAAHLDPDQDSGIYSFLPYHTK
jgi:hypothetical protein